MYHKITLIGNLGRDPEMRYTPSGQAVANFSMATTEKWTGQDGQLQERTIWWRVSAFGKQAEAIKQYLGKGSKVYVEGRMQADPKTGGPRIYTRQDNTAGSSFEVTASTIKFLSSRAEGGSAPTGSGMGQEPDAMVEPVDDIPF